MRLALASAPFAALAAFGACGRPGATRVGPLEIHGGFAFAPVTQDEAAVYLTVVNNGPTADTLVEIHCPYAKGALLHQESAAGMAALERAAISPGDSLHLAPGGLHVMLMSLDRLPRPGERIPLTLRFAHAGRVALDVPRPAVLAMTARARAVLVLAIGVAGCRPISGYRAELGSLRIIRAVLPTPSSDSEATAYLILENRGATPAALVAVRTPDARAATLYGSGWPVSQVGLAPRSSVRMTPSGYHVILTGLRRRLMSGDSVALTLRFEPGGTIGVRAPVVAYFGTAGAQVAGQAGNELVWWCAILAAAGEDQMETAYFWVGVLLACLPVAVFGTIGFFLVRMFYRQQRADSIPAAGPLPEG